MIKAQNLKFKYGIVDIESENMERADKEENFAVDHVNLHIKKGEHLAILGHNGSGKSTFAKLCNAILTPTGGDLLVVGMNTKDEENVWNIRSHAGMVFQNPDNQIVATIVEEDVAFGPENLGFEPSKIREVVDKALEVVGMYEYRKKQPHMLSGGQKQRIAIAGVLAMSPECILFDEPTSMLDPFGRIEVMETIKQLNSEGMTVVNITHFMNEAAMADRVVVMDKGKIALEGAPDYVFSNVERLRALGLDVPQVTYLSHLLCKDGYDFQRNILHSSEMVEGMKMSLDSIFFEENDYLKASNVLNSRISNVEKNKDIDTKGIKNVTEDENPSIEDVLVRAEGLCHYYSQGTSFETKALDDVSFTIKRGVFTGIIGHTGSGKSTLIQHLNGILRPTSGSLKINGKEIGKGKISLLDIRREVGLVFQYPEYQLFEETVYRDIAFGPKNLGLSGEELDERVRDAMKHVGLDYDDIKDKSPFELSGGQKRRVAIAGVLAMRPKLIILDEPTAGLDPRGRDEILDNLYRLHKSGKTSVVLVSHSMEEIAKYVDELIVMNKGKIYYQDTPRNVFSHHRELIRIGLGLPQVTELDIELKKEGYNLGELPLTVEEMRENFLRTVRVAMEINA